MITQAQLIARYGNPMLDEKTFVKKHIIWWDIPTDINALIKPLPNRIEINKDIIVPFENVLRLLIQRNLHHEIKEWNGCYVRRYQRGSTKWISRHAWGVACDLNATLNPLKKVGLLDRAALRKQYVNWSEAFLDCWRELGWNCGADWIDRIDGMHFQWDKI